MTSFWTSSPNTRRFQTCMGYKWVIMRKINEYNEIKKYKIRLVAQGFSQKPGINYEKTYSSVMDVITSDF